MTNKTKTTAPVSSVGADGEQPNIKNINEIIANETAKNNLQATVFCGFDTNCPEKSGRGGGLQTVSMTELYDTVYPPRTPVVDGFLYGALISLWVRRKWGNRSSWGSLPIMWQWGFRCGIIPSEKGRYYTLHWKMITQGFSGGCPSCSAWSVRTIYFSQRRQRH